jgi:hypothetical protein
MVSASTAEGTDTRVAIRNGGGSVVKTIRGDFSGGSRGVSLDMLDSAVEGAGYVAGTWRWQQAGYWKAVVTPSGAFAERDRRAAARGAADEAAAAAYFRAHPAEAARIRALRGRG